MRILLLLILLLAGCNQAQAPAPPPAEVKVEAVVQEDVPLYGEWVGTTDGLVNAAIKPQVSGYLLRTAYKEGRPVRKGTLLFEIDPRTFEAALAQAEGRLAQAQARRQEANSQLVAARAGVSQATSQMQQAQAALATAQGQLLQARAARDQAQAQRAKAVMDVNRLTPLVTELAVPQQQLDDAQHARNVADALVEAGTAQITIAQGGVASAQGQISAARSSLASAQAAVGTAAAAVAQADAQIQTALAELQAQRLNLEFTRLTSPIDGVPGLARAQVGDLVSPGGEPLTTVSTVDPLKVIFTIPENQALKDKQSREYTLILTDGKEYPQKGRFYGEDRTVSANTGATRVSVIFPNPAGTLKPGQYARIRALRQLDKGALLIPQRAVSELQDRSTVAVVGKEDKVEIRTVTLGERVGTRWVVKEGLQKGERVIVEGLQKAAPGATVKVATNG